MPTSSSRALDLFSDTSLLRLRSVSAHLLGLAARCCALSQTSAQTTSSTGSGAGVCHRAPPARPLSPGLRAAPAACKPGGQMYCQHQMRVVGDGPVEVNKCVINECDQEVMGAQQARKHLQLAWQSL